VKIAASSLDGNRVVCGVTCLNGKRIPCVEWILAAFKLTLSSQTDVDIRSGAQTEPRLMASCSTRVCFCFVLFFSFSLVRLFCCECVA
jgi:hypothetical protein